MKNGECAQGAACDLDGGTLDDGLRGTAKGGGKELAGVIALGIADAGGFGFAALRV